MQSYDEKHKRMIEQPLPKLLAALAAPAIVAVMITSIYNMADTFFVGLMGSSSKTGAVGVALPIMTIIQAVGFFFGHGSGNYVSRALGHKDTRDAETMAATGFYSGIVMGLVITVSGFALIKWLPGWLGATETIEPYTREYLQYIFIGAPWMVGSLILNNQLRFQGSAFYGMIGIGSGGILNIVLDPIFIFTLDMGVGGAALATILSQFVGFVLLWIGTLKGGNIRLRIKNVRPSLENYREILRGGLPSLWRQGLSSVSTMCLNLAARPYGDPAIAAFSIVSRVMMFALSAVIGFGQGFQPVCGFNYGAERYDRVRGAFWLSFKVSIVVLTAFAILGACFAPGVVEIFMTGENAEALEVAAIGAKALRLQCIFFPLLGFLTLSNMMLQTIGLAGRASVLAASRQGIFFLPAIFILPQLFGLAGVQWSQPIADLLSVLLTIPITLSVLREMKRVEERQKRLAQA